MYRPRSIESHPEWEQADRIKCYSITAHDGPVMPAPFRERLEAVKAARGGDWAQRPAFAIFHHGATGLYLVLAWWDNGNELFISVSFKGEAGDWVEDPSRHSFCLYDLEVIWAERNFYIETLDCTCPDLTAYRGRRFSQTSF
ncbi:hypothetical protein ED208_16540 [Stagnimonas aquatica]|uniref:Isochorismatase n=1 Tax=Stagnimonas aquatica TaxID=2689987 RepID=A0A3N0UZE4_9GAMM|nr:hypothetical protein [Stagnimonas aquatica]ROH85618.1 hypothetical protein ED208_16540 [Stagnimonas aquatica]